MSVFVTPDNLVSKIILDCSSFIPTVYNPNPTTSYDGNVFLFNNSLVTYR
jgi:hypothetical protein